MARKKSTETIDVAEKDQVEGIEEIDEIEDVADMSVLKDLEEEVVEDVSEAALAVEDGEEVASDDLDDGADEEGGEAALGELEEAELSMLTPDEAAEVIRVDEAAEVASLRRAELALDTEADGVAAGEFVCSSCFLVKKNTQLANKSKQICSDCAA